jgi:hypothetical protein
MTQRKKPSMVLTPSNSSEVLKPFAGSRPAVRVATTHRDSSSRVRVITAVGDPQPWPNFRSACSR